MFAKNGNDVTTLALTVARAQTGKKTVLVQPQGYHGAGPVWTKERPKFYLDPTMFDSWLSTFSFVFFKKSKLMLGSLHILETSFLVVFITLVA